MARLANYLASVRGVQRPVVDRTMLDGIYGFTLNYSTTDGDDRPDIFTALPEELGLKLQPTRAPIEMWFVDHVERPSAN
jgi:bla regulator protein BlaR1